MWEALDEPGGDLERIKKNADYYKENVAGKGIYTRFQTGSNRLICDNIREAYLEDRRPWVIGFSGGKDSILLLQLIWTTIAGLTVERREKRIFVLGSDTAVETPDISARIRGELDRIQKDAEDQNLPISTHTIIDNSRDKIDQFFDLHKLQKWLNRLLLQR